MKFRSAIAIFLSLACIQAQADIREKLRAAENSPLFQQALAVDQITDNGLSQIEMHNGARLDFAKYAYLTRLDRNTRFRGLFESKSVKRFLQSKPHYDERILKLEDRLIIDRVMRVSLQKGTCSESKLPTVLSELCFVGKAGDIREETRRYLEGLRFKLESLESTDLVKAGLTAGELSDMDDKSLLEALVNSDEREIRLVSVLPTVVYNSVKRSNLWNTREQLRASDFRDITDGTSNTLQFSGGSSAKNKATSANHQFQTQYFLTGFTLGREVSDTFEVQFAPATIISDRYFVQFNYEFSAGFGLRFPYSVSVESKAQNRLGKSRVAVNAASTHSASDKQPNTRKPVTRNPVTRDQRKVNDHRMKAKNVPQVAAGERNKNASAQTHASRAQVEIAVAPVNVARNGSPAYQAVDLPESQFFNGKEFVLKLHASCSFHASIPGDDIKQNCPAVDVDKSRDVDPIIGDEKTRLGRLWLEGTATGLSVNFWAGEASLDFGLESNITNGRIRMDINGFNNSYINGRSMQNLEFRDRNIQVFDVVNRSKKSVAFNLNKPSYGMDVELLPVVRARFELDLGIKVLKKTMGPYSLDALSLSAGTSMGHHEGTVRSHNYSL